MTIIKNKHACQCSLDFFFYLDRSNTALVCHCLKVVSANKHLEPVFEKVRCSKEKFGLKKLK